MGGRAEAAHGDLGQSAEQGAPEARSDARTEPQAGGVRSSEIGFRDLILESGGIRVDVKNFLAWVNGEPLELRIMEFALLANLMLAPGELKTRKELSRYLWEDTEPHSTRAIDVHIQRIRAALSQKSCEGYIRSVRGLGYRFATVKVPEDI